MVLSKRLNAIAECIRKGARVIDVGCDHALLDIYLTLENRNECIASDINENVLKKTMKMIASYHLENKIEVVQSDGLDNIEIKRDDIVVIAGMGATTILTILSRKKLEHLIIQSNNDLEIVRRETSKMGYKIIEEKVVYEKKLYYIIMSLIKGKSDYTEKECLLGPILIQKKDEITISYFEYLLKRKENIIKNIPKNSKEYNQFLLEMKYLKEVLEKEKNL